jgi:hypothetical protein
MKVLEAGLFQGNVDTISGNRKRPGLWLVPAKNHFTGINKMVAVHLKNRSPIQSENSVIRLGGLFAEKVNGKRVGIGAR